MLHFHQCRAQGGPSPEWGRGRLALPKAGRKRAPSEQNYTNNCCCASPFYGRRGCDVTAFPWTELSSSVVPCQTKPGYLWSKLLEQEMLLSVHNILNTLFHELFPFYLSLNVLWVVWYTFCNLLAITASCSSKLFIAVSVQHWPRPPQISDQLHHQ